MKKGFKVSIIVISCAILTILLSFGATYDGVGCGAENISDSENENSTNQNMDEEVPLALWNEGDSQKQYKSETQNSCLSDEKREIYDSMWKNKKEGYIDDMVKNLRLGYMSSSLYFLQSNLQGALDKAIIEKNAQQIDQIAEIALIAYDYLTEVNTLQLYQGSAGNGTWQPVSVFTGGPFKIWKDEEYQEGREGILYSSQFLYFISRITNAITILSRKDRTSTMLKFIEKYNPLILSTYERWIFSQYGPFSVMNGWGCNVTPDNGINRYNHSDYIDLLLTKSFAPYRTTPPAICNWVSDVDMWVGSGVAELIMANDNNKSLVRISNPTAYKEYIGRFRNLLSSRISKEIVTDFYGKSVTACGFDHGIGSLYDTVHFAGLEDSIIPVDPISGELSMDPVPDPNVGWDFSHARRFVNVFGTFHDYGKKIKSGYPSTSDMKCLANQVAYNVFKKGKNNIAYPIFNNFMNGANGWYNVLSGCDPTISSCNAGTGNGPSDNSYAFPEGGWNFWSKYNPDIRKLADGLWDLIGVASVHDLTNNNNDGWVQGGVNWLNGAGRDGTGTFEFDGINDKIEVKSTNFQFTEQKISVEAWINPSDYAVNYVQGIVDKFNNKGSWGLYIGGGYFRFRIRDASSNCAQVYYSVATAGGNNNWYHLTGTYDESSGALKLYVNGDLKKESITTYVMSNSTYPLYIGFAQNNTYPQTSEGYFKGKIDDVRIYNRVLSNNEVLLHYNGSITDNNKLIASYDFNEFDQNAYNHLRNHYGSKIVRFNRIYGYDSGIFNLQDSQLMFSFVSSFCDARRSRPNNEIKGRAYLDVKKLNM